MNREGNLEAPTRHAIEWKGPDYYDEGKISLQDLQAAQDAAAEDSIKRLEATGEPIVTDGEQRESSFATYNLTDTLAGTDGSDSFYGARGNDTILGRGGDDVLNGARGVDSLDGGDGTDRCIDGETVTNCES